jgi:protein-L-isoaspartate(D-aspartate) O-methyltransferase
MENIPRHFFLDPAFDKIAYEDRAFQIGAGQTISQPYTVAFQTELLDVKPFEKVLEIGTGSVYQSSVLAEIGALVFTIERQKELYDRTQISYPLKKKYATKIKFFYGDGFEGLPGFAPFDKILITAAAPFVPEKLIAQLKPGGKMVLPLGEQEDRQTMTRITKLADGTLETESFSDFVFVPMLSGKATKA